MKIKNIFNFVNETFRLSNKLNIFYLVIVALLIIFAYLPTLQYDFATIDQWRSFQYSILNESALVKAYKCLHSAKEFSLRSGLILSCISGCLEHALVGKISDFSTTRPFVLIFVIFTAFFIGMALSPSVGGIVNGTAVGALFVLSPGYADIYYAGLSHLMILIALILATLSYIFIRQALDEDLHKNKLLLSSAFFLAACMIYPAWAFVVFIFSLIDFLFCTNLEQNTKLKHLLIKILFFTIISVIYYLIIKLIIIFLPAYNLGTHEFAANFSPVYLSKRFLIAALFYLLQPPLNTLYISLNIINFLFLFFLVLICSILFFKNNFYNFKNAIFLFLLTIFICAFLIFVSVAPWLLSQMPQTANRHFISFSLLICLLISWVIFIIANKLFPTKKHLSTILLVFIILLPAAVIQNKRTAIEVGISQTEIATMRMIVHKWIDDNSFIKKRYIIAVKPKRPRPLFYDQVLNNVIFGDSLKLSDNPKKYLNENNDPLFVYNVFWELMKEIDDHYGIWTCLNQILKIRGYGDSLVLSTDTSHYCFMFIAVLREKCDRYHPLANMNFYFIPSNQEITLDISPLNIVFTVINQGDRIATKHEILEINFSLITNHPEPLIVEKREIGG